MLFLRGGKFWYWDGKVATRKSIEKIMQTHIFFFKFEENLVICDDLRLSAAQIQGFPFQESSLNWRKLHWDVLSAIIATAHSNQNLGASISFVKDNRVSSIHTSLSCWTVITFTSPAFKSVEWPPSSAPLKSCWPFIWSECISLPRSSCCSLETTLMCFVQTVIMGLSRLRTSQLPFSTSDSFSGLWPTAWSTEKSADSLGSWLAPTSAVIALCSCCCLRLRKWSIAHWMNASQPAMLRHVVSLFITFPRIPILRWNHRKSCVWCKTNEAIIFPFDVPLLHSLFITRLPRRSNQGKSRNFPDKEGYVSLSVTWMGHSVHIQYCRQVKFDFRGYFNCNRMQIIECEKEPHFTRQ